MHDKPTPKSHTPKPHNPKSHSRTVRTPQATAPKSGDANSNTDTPQTPPMAKPWQGIVDYFTQLRTDFRRVLAGTKTEITIISRLIMSFFSGAKGVARIMGLVIGAGAVLTLWHAHIENRLPNILLPQMRVENDENLDVNGLSAVLGQWQHQDNMMRSLYSQDHFIPSGGNLDYTLRKANISRSHRLALIKSLTKVFDPRDLRVGQKIILRYGGGAGKADPMKLYEMAIAINAMENIRVYRTDMDKASYAVEVIRTPMVTRHVRSDGVIESSLYMAATDVGVPLNVLGNMINMFSFDIDFQRQVRKGDTFSLFYERYHHQDTGEIIKTGKILMGEMVVNGTNHRYYRFMDGDGIVDFYNRDGVSARKTLMKTPINGARLSSGYGRRKHPILGYTKIHRGVDFAAPRGTPIYAAGHGVIERASYYGAYGNFVQIKHRNGYQTRYAHMSRIARGLARGKTVQQGSIIGYVGSTGRSTGPHLHYEVLYNGKHLNPARLKMPKGKTLTGIELDNFMKTRDKLDAEINRTAPSIARQ